MTLTLNEMQAGIRFWRATRWDADFHNAFYVQLAAANPNGNFTAQWWADFLPLLRRWRAARGAGSSTADLDANFARAETALQAAWATIAPYRQQSVEQVRWEDVSALPDAVHEIRARSVFKSKFCHFLLPRIFAPVDYYALGRGGWSYERYFREIQAEWAATDPATQQALWGTLAAQIRATGQTVFADYPVVNKIVELCLVGRRHP